MLFTENRKPFYKFFNDIFRSRLMMNMIPAAFLKMIDFKIDYPVFFVTGCFMLWIFSSKDEENLYLRRILEKFYMYIDGINFMILSFRSSRLL